MKKLAEVERAKNDYTKQASDVTRQLAFAGFAVIWLIKDPAGTNPFSSDVLPALVAFAITLTLDVFHYAASSLIWVVFYNYHHDQTSSDDTLVDIPGAVNWFGYTCFWLKLLALLYGWSSLFDAINHRWQVF